MDGFTVCQRIRRESDTPIIMLTVRSEDEDIVHGLELGADDYMAKPFSPRQLVRGRMLCCGVGRSPFTRPREIGYLKLSTNRREVIVSDGEPIALTPLEGRMLDYLMANAGLVLTFEALIDHVWGPEGADRDMLRQLIRRLRSKIEPDPANPRYIYHSGAGLFPGNRAVIHHLS